MDRLSAMEVFVRVVETGGFSAAARDLGLSKSAVSKQVAAIEERLGARLLNRTTRRLSPTDAGAAYHARAVRLLAEAEEMEAEIGQLASSVRGTLRINAPVTFGIRHLGPLLPDLMSAHPDLEVDLVLNDRVVDLVDEGFDVAVRIAQLADSSLMARRLCRSRRLVVASPAYIARRGAPQTPEDMADHDCVLYSYLLREGAWDLSGPDGRRAAVRITRGRLRANNGDVLLQAAIDGLGLAMMPTFIVGPALADGSLIRVLPEWQDDTGSVYAVHPHARFTPAKVRVFVDFLAQRFHGEPAWDRACR